MIFLVNISSGDVMLDSMNIVLSRGTKLMLAGSLVENLVLYPEISLFLNRGRIAVEETSERPR